MLVPRPADSPTPPIHLASLSLSLSLSLSEAISWEGRRQASERNRRSCT